MDFSDTEKAKRQFETYIKKKVKGKLQPSLSSISPATRIILANVIYFNADWFFEFEAAKPGLFNLKDGQQTSVGYLHLDEKLRYGDPEWGQWVELPYDVSISGCISQYSILTLLFHSRLHPVQSTIP
jgi:serine protease inhibitor